VLHLVDRRREGVERLGRRRQRCLRLLGGRLRGRHDGAGGSGSRWGSRCVDGSGGDGGGWRNGSRRRHGL
jgi:hypothetical protein